LANARGDGAHADLGDQFDADAGVAVGILRSWISSARSSME